MSILNGKLSRRRVLQYGGAAALAAAATPKAFGQSDAAVTLNVWSPAPAFPQVVEAYKAVKPNVTINLTASPWPEHLIKLRNGIRANGQGLPDIAQLQSRDLPSFVMTQSLADLAPLGANEIGGDFTPWVWNQVKRGDAVMGLPLDFGPMILIHRPDIFEAAGAAVPKTWDEFRTAAEAIRKHDSNVYITNANLNTNWITGLFWQAGEQPYREEGDAIRIDIANEQALKVANYWQELLAADLVSLRPGYNTEWFAAMDADQYACWPGASWASNGMQRNYNASIGKWRVAPIPTWEAGNYVSGNLGGSTVVMFDNSPNKDAAAEFLFWAMHGEGSWELVRQGILVPLTNVHQSDEFRSIRMPLYGDQAFLDVVTESAAAINPDRQYSPFEDFIETTLVEECSQVYVQNGTIADALGRTQEKVVAFAKEQGFNVL